MFGWRVYSDVRSRLGVRKLIQPKRLVFGRHLNVNLFCQITDSFSSLVNDRTRSSSTTDQTVDNSSKESSLLPRRACTEYELLQRPNAALMQPYRYSAPLDPNVLFVERHRLSREEFVFQYLFAALAILSYLFLLGFPLTLVFFYIPRLRKTADMRRSESRLASAFFTSTNNGFEQEDLVKNVPSVINSLSEILSKIERPLYYIVYSFHPLSLYSLIYAPLISEMKALFRKHGIPIEILVLDLSNPGKVLHENELNVNGYKTPKFPAVLSPFLHIVVPYGMSTGDAGVLEYTSRPERDILDDQEKGNKGVGIHFSLTEFLRFIERNVMVLPESVWKDTRMIDEAKSQWESDFLGRYLFSESEGTDISEIQRVCEEDQRQNIKTHSDAIRCLLQRPLVYAIIS